MIKPAIALLLLFLTAFSSSGQIHHYYVDPDSTAVGMQKIYNGHFITVGPAGHFNNKLFISIPGTGGKPQSLYYLDSVAASAGYHVISIDYPSKRNTATFVNSTDRLAFDKFRQELNFGTPVSDSISVDTLNSIANRITSLVIYLAKTHPNQGWNKFLSGRKLKWRKVVLAGHSQGAGHVAYLAHYFKVHRVIMLSGPQDFLSCFNTPAPWLSARSKTPAKSYYALLHRNDIYNTSSQVKDDLATMHADSSVINHFTITPAINRKSRIFISDAPIGPAQLYNDPQRANQPLSIPAGVANHLSTILLVYEPVWLYLLKN
jgi:pimeloyl-ACP methyl ester carboxylesterase